MQICVIDNGYYNTDIYQVADGLREKQKTFRSKVKKTDIVLPKTNSFLVEYEGVKYEVGDGAEDININFDKTEDNFYKIITLTALALMTKENSEEFRIVNNIPLNLYSKENVANMQNYLCTGEDYIPLEINKERKNIRISQVVTYPQTISACHINNVKNNIEGYLDIGGITVQGIIMNGVNPIWSTKFSEKLGTLILKNKIRRELNREFNISIGDYELDDIFKFGLSFSIEKSLKIINEICFDHVKQIKKAMELADWNIKNIEILLLGGGSLDLEDHLMKIIPHPVMSINPRLDSVKGLWYVAKALKWA